MFSKRSSLTPVSMQTTHSELPGPSTGLGAEGVTGVPGVSGGLGIWKAEVLGSIGGEAGDGAVGTTSASSSSSCSTALQAPAEKETISGQQSTFNALNIVLCSCSLL